MFDPTNCQEIPSMGGREIAPYLYETACSLKGGGDVVECGSWLGASVAPVGMALRDTDSKATIHCFDRWRATAWEVKRASEQGVAISEGDNLVDVFKQNVCPIYPRLVSHQGWTHHASWDGPPIELYIDDANKSPREFRHALMTFAPWWIPGATVVVLMDFSFYRKPYHTAVNRYRYMCQKRFVDSHSDCFEILKTDIKGTSAASFRYVKPCNWEEVDA